MKMHTLSTLKLFLLFETCFNLCYAQKKENYTEKDWVNYAKAQGNSYEFTLKSLKNIMADKEYEDYLDSMARVDIFKSLFYNGVEIRKVEIKPPLLTGTVSYYFLDGKLASQAEFINGVANGKCIYYYPNGNIYKKEVYKNGETNYSDTVKTFTTKGQLFMEEFETDYFFKSRGYSYNAGKLWSESIFYTGKIDTTNEKYFDEVSKTEKSRVYVGEKYLENFYDNNGKKIGMNKWYLLMMQEQKKNPFELFKAFPKMKKDISELKDEELYRDFYTKRKNDRKRIIYNWGISENFISCSNNKVFENINSKEYRMYCNFDYPHATSIDTLYCEPNKQIMRTAQTNKGKLNGELKYYYPSGQLLALLNFKEDYPDGAFIIYYADGNIKKSSKYKMGISVDTTFDFSNNNILKMFTVWEDSVKHVKKTYWEDGKTIQQLEKCTGEVTAVQKKYAGKYVVGNKIIENRFYNKNSEEISKKQFSKQYPGILEEYDPRKVRAKF